MQRRVRPHAPQLVREAGGEQPEKQMVGQARVLANPKIRGEGRAEDDRDLQAREIEYPNDPVFRPQERQDGRRNHQPANDRKRCFQGVRTSSSSRPQMLP
jgi:hypothetical protein